MENKKNILTYAGLKKLEDELEHLKVVKRKEVSQKIKEAREQGDFYLRMLSMMQLRMSSAISRLVSRKSRKSLKMQRLLLRRRLTLTRFLSDVRSAS